MVTPCLGLILGAVAKELFPQISSVSKKDSFIGLTAGFFIGLLFVNYLPFITTAVETHCTCCFAAEGEDTDGSAGARHEHRALIEEDTKSYQSGDAQSQESEEAFMGYGESETGSEPDADHPVIRLAVQAVASPMHRERIRSKVSELLDSILQIETKSLYLHKYLHKNLSPSEAESFADQIDEEIHKFMYNLDHCRRYGMPSHTPCPCNRQDPVCFSFNLPPLPLPLSPLGLSKALGRT